jgi:hypothetical protein
MKHDVRKKVAKKNNIPKYQIPKFTKEQAEKMTVAMNEKPMVFSPEIKEQQIKRMKI